MGKSGGIRLYVDEPLGAGQAISLDRAQAHYLFNVMRLADGAEMRLFNGRDGEWVARISRSGKTGAATCEAQSRPQSAPLDLHLMFAPVKRAKTDLIIEKAVELGVGQITPVTTEYTSAERVRMDRLEKIAIEAAEQSGRLCLPRIAPARRLFEVLGSLANDVQVLWLNERESARPVPEVLADLRGPAALLVGPEGGFSPGEIAQLRDWETCHSASLGPRILRAETAVIAGLSLLQSHLGDWR